MPGVIRRGRNPILPVVLVGGHAAARIVDRSLVDDTKGMIVLVAIDQGRQPIWELHTRFGRQLTRA